MIVFNIPYNKKPYLNIIMTIHAPDTLRVTSKIYTILIIPLIKCVGSCHRTLFF